MKWQTGFIGCLMLAAQTSAWAITYHVSPIAPGSAEAINEQGQITGWSDDAYVAQSDLSILKLGTFGGDDSSAYGINDQGQVVGHAQLPPGDQTVHAFRGFHNRPLNRATDDIGTLGGEWSVALDINNLGQVIGQSDVGDSVGRAFRTAPNAPINPATDDLGTLGGINSDAQAINDLGQVVGTSQYPDGSSHAYRTRPNLPINPATDDLGIPPGFTDCAAQDINELGEVIGSCRSGDVRRGYKTRPNQPIDLETSFFGGNARIAPIAINDHGWVVGYRLDQGGQRAILYDGAKIIDLNEVLDDSGAGWILWEASDINNLGQIVGTGLYNGNRAFLLTPVIPEPTTVVLATIGVIVLVVSRRRLIKRCAQDS